MGEIAVELARKHLWLAISSSMNAKSDETCLRHANEQKRSLTSNLSFLPLEIVGL